VAVAGSASFVAKGNYLTVTTTNGANNSSAINWQSFSIPQGSTTYFQQPNASSTVLNRVVTNTPSLIFGTLGSNGNVLLVNQSGITIGATAVVDTAGFTAAAMQRNDNNIGYGTQVFGYGGVVAGNLQVQGGAKILARGVGGDVVLLGGSVNVDANALIQAPNGNVILAAGETVTMTSRGLDNISFTLGSSSSAAVNLGTLEGNAVGIFANTLTHSGSILANGVAAVTDDGRVYLKSQWAGTGTATVNGTITAKKTASGYGGDVQTSAGSVQIGTATSVNTLNGSNAGLWTITAPNFTVAADAGSLPGSGMKAATLNSALVNNNVSIATSGYGGTINVAGDLSWANRVLELSGQNGPSVNIHAVLSGNNAGLNLAAATDFGMDNTGAFAGRVDLNASSSLSIGGTTYTLIGSPANMGLTGNYALAGNATVGNLTIGSSATRFTGTFNGMGHTVSGLSLHTSASDVACSAISAAPEWSATCGWMARRSRVAAMSVPWLAPTPARCSNVSVTGSTVKAEDDSSGANFGGLVGVNAGQVINARSATVLSGTDTVGGLVGLNNGSITLSKATGNVTGQDGVGGLVGYNHGGTVVDNAYYTTYFEGSVTGNNEVGGLVGTNTGTLVGLSVGYGSTAGQVVGANGVGGAVGKNDGGTVFSSRAKNVVSGLDSVGGLVGGNVNGGQVTNSYTYNGSVTGTGAVGGLVGSNDGTVSASYSGAWCVVAMQQAVWADWSAAMPAASATATP